MRSESPADAGPQAADAAHDQVDLGARARRRVERVDRGGVGEPVHLRDDAPARPRLARDPVEQAQAQALGRHEQLLVVARAAAAREALEQLRDVARDVLAAREQADVLVERGRDGVVVARGHVAVALQPAAFLAHDVRELGVGLEAEHAVHHVRARALECARALEIVRLVEARLQLDEHDDLLAARGRALERLHDAALRAARAVDRGHDHAHGGIFGGRGQERADRALEALVGMVHEHVALAQRAEHASLARSRSARPPRNTSAGVHGASLCSDGARS